MSDAGVGRSAGDPPAGGTVVRIKEVQILWSENGLFNRRYPPGSGRQAVFRDMKECSGMLVAMAGEVNHDGYDKTAFLIVWEDGATYRGRYDLHRAGDRQENPNGMVDLADHVRSQAEFRAGLRRPAHMSEQEYERALAGSQRSMWKEMLGQRQIA